MSNIDPAQTIRLSLGDYLRSGMAYHSKLPADHQDWYVYTVDGGHSILCWLGQHQHMIIADPQNAWKFAVPVPVLSILRNGYAVVEGCIVVRSLKYDGFLGVVVPPGDEEYASDHDSGAGRRP